MSLLESQTGKTNQRTTETVGETPQLVCRRHPDTGKHTKAQIMQRESKAVQLLTHLGIQISLKKSLSQPQQQVTYLGHI